jgi:multidrug resistance efflux pump
MDKDFNQNVKSEELREILGTPPGWLLRFGTLLFFIILVLLFWLSYWIQYPEVVEDEIIISFNDPPTTLISPKSGFVDLIFVDNNQMVKKGQLLISYKSDADYQDVLSIYEILKPIDISDYSQLSTLKFKEALRVGELQNDLLIFLETQKQYSNEINQSGSVQIRKDLRRQMDALEKGIQYANNLKENLYVQIENIRIQIKNEEAMVKMDKLSQTELNKTRDKYVDFLASLNATEAEIKDKQFKINSLRNELISVSDEKEKGREQAELKLTNAFLELKATISGWLYAHLIISPTSGVLQMTNNTLKPGQYVNKEDGLMLVIPSQTNKMKGMMHVAFTKSGQIKINQKVIVKLKSYPEAKYGVLLGRVNSISKVAIKINEVMVSPVHVGFNDTLRTTNGFIIPVDQELSGIGRIITKNKRFIQRLF